MTPRALVGGIAAGPALVLSEPLSFWGGLDATSGLIVDRRHPQSGSLVTGRVLVMPSGRGSSSSSSVLAEAIRLGTAPAAVLLGEADPITALGALVARELYGPSLPVILVDPATYVSIDTGDHVDVDATRLDDPVIGIVRLSAPPDAGSGFGPATA